MSWLEICTNLVRILTLLLCQHFVLPALHFSTSIGDFFQLYSLICFRFLSLAVTSLLQKQDNRHEEMSAHGNQTAFSTPVSIDHITSKTKVKNL